MVLGEIAFVHNTAVGVGNAVSAGLGLGVGLILVP